MLQDLESHVDTFAHIEYAQLKAIFCRKFHYLCFNLDVLFII